MRPDKPGYWWYETNEPDGSHLNPWVIRIRDEHDIVGEIRYIEECLSVSRWLGPVVPPKKIQRYEIGLWDDDIGQLMKSDSGDVVLYEDVEKYDLKT